MRSFAPSPNSVLSQHRFERASGNPRTDDAGQRMQLAVAQDEGRARELWSGRAGRRGRARCTVRRGRFLHEQRVGAGVDNEFADPFGLDDAAGPLGSRSSTTTDRLRLRELVGGRRGRRLPPPMTATSTVSILELDIIVPRSQCHGRRASALPTRGPGLKARATEGLKSPA